jgi:hypothetical protein
MAVVCHMRMPLLLQKGIPMLWVRQDPWL